MTVSVASPVERPSRFQGIAPDGLSLGEHFALHLKFRLAESNLAGLKVTPPEGIYSVGGELSEGEPGTYRFVIFLNRKGKRIGKWRAATPNYRSITTIIESKDYALGLVGTIADEVHYLIWTYDVDAALARLVRLARLDGLRRGSDNSIPTQARHCWAIRWHPGVSILKLAPRNGKAILPGSWRQPLLFLEEGRIHPEPPPEGFSLQEDYLQVGSASLPGARSKELTSILSHPHNYQIWRVR